MADLSIAVLLSAGRHPVTGRPRAADSDARALRLALALAQKEAVLTVLHAGQHDEPALGDYLGMGLDTLTVLGPLTQADDAVPVLADALRTASPDIVLCGTTAEHGEGSGMLPYLIAQDLCMPCIANVTDLVREENGLTALAAEPAGRRRRFRLTASAVLAVGAAASAPLQVAWGRTRQGKILIHRAGASIDAARASWTLRPFRIRPARIFAGPDSMGGKRIVQGVPPSEAAAEIRAFLQQAGVMRAGNSTSTIHVPPERAG